MKKIVKGLLLAGLMTPVVLNAYGMGVSVPFMTSVEHKVDDGYKWEEDSISGLGLVIDSNIGKNKLYNWRLNLETNKIKAKSGGKYDKSSIINTFGFSLFRNETVRVFMGPRVEFGFIDEDGWDGADISLSPALGINVNLGSTVSLGLDMDYKIKGLSHSPRNYDDDDSYHDYDEKLSDVTARLYLLFRFGEKY